MKTYPEIEAYRNDLHLQETVAGINLQFKTTWGLFSPKAIDEGSRLLLEHMEIYEGDSCLDVGCGYGPLGLFMAKQANKGTSCLIDKDFVAIDYSNKNIHLNKLDNCECFLSNGFASLGDRRFSLIVSNLPAKVGNEMLSLYMIDALKYLKPGGRFYVVTISGIRKFIQRSFKEYFGNYKKLKQGKTYTVAMAIKEPR
ncbi:MAG: methyltransferase [Pseudomonadota bacterium]